MGKVHGSLARAGMFSFFPMALIPAHSHLTHSHRQGQERYPQSRQGREAQDPQGPCLQARGVHSPIRECHHDWRQASGMYLLIDISRYGETSG